MGPWNEQGFGATSSTSKKGQLNAKGLLGMAGSAFSAMEGSDKINQGFKERNRNLFTSDARRKQLESAGFQSGNVYGMIGAAVSAAGRQVDKASKDEFGMYKSKAGEFFDNSFDWGNGIEFWKDTLNGKVDGEGVMNQLSLGLIGKSRRQRELGKAKQVFEFENTARSAQSHKEAGSEFANSLGRYEAPAYGRKGMKIRTKFSGY